MDDKIKESVARVMVRCKGYSRLMGLNFAAGLTDQEAAAIAALEVEQKKDGKVTGYAVQENCGPKLVGLLDEIADRQAKEKAEKEKAAEEAKAKAALIETLDELAAEDAGEGDIDTDLE